VEDKGREGDRQKKKKKKKITGSGKRKRGGKEDFRAGHLPKTNRFEVFIFVF